MLKALSGEKQGDAAVAAAWGEGMLILSRKPGEAVVVGGSTAPVGEAMPGPADPGKAGGCGTSSGPEAAALIATTAALAEEPSRPRPSRVVVLRTPR